MALVAVEHGIAAAAVSASMDVAGPSAGWMAEVDSEPDQGVRVIEVVGKTSFGLVVEEDLDLHRVHKPAAADVVVVETSWVIYFASYLSRGQSVFVDQGGQATVDVGFRSCYRHVLRRLTQVAADNELTSS